MRDTVQKRSGPKATRVPRLMFFKAQLESVVKTESTVESFIRYKSELEHGVLGNANQLKKTDRSRLLLGSRAAKMENAHIPMAVHYRNQNRWRKRKGTRKAPRILDELRD